VHLHPASASRQAQAVRPAACALLLLGCGEDPPPLACGAEVDCEAVRAGDVEIEVGRGDPIGPVFEALGEGAHLPLEEGVQGGYHVYLSARTRGLCPARVVLERVLRVAGDDVVHREQRSVRHRLVTGAGGWWVVASAPQTFVCPPTHRDQPMHDVPLEVDFTVSEDPLCLPPGADPRTATATARFVADCPPEDDVCAGDDRVGCAAWEGG
jgi:hypothetical protein